MPSISKGNLANLVRDLILPKANWELLDKLQKSTKKYSRTSKLSEKIWRTE